MAEITGNTQTDWQQEYVYDRWGNRTIHQTNTWGAAIPKPNFTMDANTNRLTAPTGYAMTYDSVGNLTNDTYSGQGQRTYDAENRMTQAWANSQWQTYTYDASGQRVRRNVNGVETWQVYGLGGELLAEYAASAAAGSPQREYGYRNGQLLVTASSGVSNSGLVGYWKFDENTGTTAADSSGNGNTGTLISSAIWAQGQSGAAVSLNGVSDYVKIKDGKISTATTGTISAWVKINSLANGPKIVGYGGSAAANVQAIFALELRQDGSNFYFSVIDVPADGSWAADSAHGSTVVQAGVWYHLALTSNGSSWKLYVNGVAETITNQLGNGNTGKWFGNTTAAIPDKTAIGGCRFNGVDYAGINGLIDEARIYDRVLSAGEIATLASGGGNSANINWLVTDQLGTPRMVFDKTGALANVKRHDYLPFGEELSAGQGLRTTTLGYGASDGIRQKFTSQERDNETGLDYMHARYFASAQGRFTSADTVAGSIGDPQSLNRYAYVGNNPTNFSDPTGHDRFSASSNGFAAVMGQGSNMYPEDPDYDMGLPQKYLAEIASWKAENASHDALDPASESGLGHRDLASGGKDEDTDTAEGKDPEPQNSSQEASGGTLGGTVIGPPVINADPSGQEASLRDWILRHPNGIGDGDCAQLGQVLAEAQGTPLGLAGSGRWRAGDPASGNLAVPRGTALISGVDADGFYPNYSDYGNHFAILLSHLPNGGLKVLEQIKGEVRIRDKTDLKSSSYFLNPKAFYVLITGPAIAGRPNKPNH